MGTIQIKKYERTVTIGKGNEQRQKVTKTYGKIIYRGTLSLADTHQGGQNRKDTKESGAQV